MPHISKRKLGARHLASLYEELVRSFERSFSETATKSVFQEFFTHTERIMFAKRLAVIAMLSRDISTYAIAEALGMSPSTINRMSVRYENDKYNQIIKKALGKKDIWEIIDSLLTVGGLMPPRTGRTRWRNFNQAVYKDKLKRS